MAKKKLWLKRKLKKKFSFLFKKEINCSDEND